MTSKYTRLHFLGALTALAGAVLASPLCLAETKPKTATAPATTTPAKTVRLLTIGNSFSANATHFLPDLAAADGNKLVHRPIVVGGAPLQLHAEKAQKFEANPEDKEGLYTGGHSLKQDLLSDPWDFVTIQQASIKSHDLSTYRPFAGWLRDYVKKHAPQAELLMHETWAYRRDDPRFTKASGKSGEPQTQEEMYRMLNAAYTTTATELGVRRLPVGDAFYLADTDPKWGYQPDTKFDAKSAKQPALPDQTHSLHKGWSWAKPKDGAKTTATTLGMDGHHASTAGEYLGGCVWYEVLFGKSVVDNKFVPPGLDKEYAAYLRQTAHAAVEKSKAPPSKP